MMAFPSSPHAGLTDIHRGNWDPRTIVLFPSDQETRLRGRIVTPVAKAWPAKDPGEIVEYRVLLASLPPGVLIVQLDPVISPAGAVTVAALSYEGDTVRLLLMGGADGVNASVGLVFMLSNGQRLVRSVTLPIIQLVDIPTPPPDALTLNGFPLTIGGMTINVGDSQLTISGSPVLVSGEPISFGGE